jgi:hypothetical protein
MDFTLSETQNELAALTRQIVSDKLTQERLKALEKNAAHIDRDLTPRWRRRACCRRPCRNQSVAAAWICSSSAAC